MSVKKLNVFVLKKFCCHTEPVVQRNSLSLRRMSTVLRFLLPARVESDSLSIYYAASRQRDSKRAHQYSCFFFSGVHDWSHLSVIVSDEKNRERVRILSTISRVVQLLSPGRVHKYVSDADTVDISSVQCTTLSLDGTSFWAKRCSHPDIAGNSFRGRSHGGSCDRQQHIG